MGEISGEIGKERILGGLLKTGQTTQYGGYADDGYYEKGLSKQYSILTAGQHAGTTSITIATKTDLISNNCVYDRRSKLMWSRYPSDGLGPAEDGKMPWTTDGNGHGIFAFVAAANLAKLAGYDDWRIPNDFELVDLRNMEQPTAAPDAVAFPGWPIDTYFWTSTSYPTNTNLAQLIRFDMGSIGGGVKNENFYVALVRGG
jgi:hypothetical protein